MSGRVYRLTVKTSAKSATAFCLSADCDDDAVGQAMRLLNRVQAFCERPSCEMVRADGSIVRELLPRPLATTLATA